MKKLLSAIALSALCMSTFAQMAGEPPPAFKKAFDECYPTVPKDAQGKPDHPLMDKCMATKGFIAPRIQPQVAAVFNECATSVKKDANNQPEKVAMQACMASKGVNISIEPVKK